jgi:hypothetical protein
MIPELDDRGRMKLRPAATYADTPTLDLFTWCAQHARYGIPTTELVEFLRELIGDRRALEIGAGQGDLGGHLGIPMTDSAKQSEDQQIARYYRAIGQFPTDPPADVDRLEAIRAIETYSPSVVIGSWITQLYQPGDETTKTRAAIGSSIYGVDERDVIERVQTYIHIGNRKTHGDKRLLARPHRVVRAPWIVSRSLSPEDNEIYIWNR